MQNQVNMFRHDYVAQKLEAVLLPKELQFVKEYVNYTWICEEPMSAVATKGNES